ncbi:MAG: glyoxalase/bleomycin resistance/extradiol dioxygenase family protein [Rhodospirillaceae bacterium]|nr:glyoxalase/bleomycin resistance/extradiol dioxygenase family protein [Rhodospirillales bacterium]
MAEWSLVPYLMLSDAHAAMEFYRKAFGAEEIARMTTPDGKRIVHAEMSVHDCRIYLSDDFCQPQSGSRIGLHLEVPDADQALAQAAEAGAKVTMPVSEMFWGARYGKVEDPFGVAWSVSTQVRQPSEAEMKAAIAEWFSKPQE